jgi:hypothetical protein
MTPMSDAVACGLDRLTRSKHAEERCRARSIPERVLQLVMLYGRQVRRRGANVFLLDRQGFQEMLAYESKKEISRLLPKLRAYFVVSDDWTLVTAGYVRDPKPGFAPPAKQVRSKARALS